MVSDPMRECVDGLADVPGVELALFVFHPSPNAMEVRFAPHGDRSKWRLLEKLAAKFRKKGKSEELAAPVNVDGVPYHLVATTLNPFLKQGTPFIVALVAGGAPTPGVLEALRAVIQDCMGLAYRR